MSIIFLPIAWLYGGVLKLRHRLYDWGWFPSKRFELPVICVGNLALGGTGKTPHVEYLIRLLSESQRVGVVSRGYERKTRGFCQANDHSTADDIGDEPMQYHSKFPLIQVAVDENRNEAIARMLGADNPPQVVLLDDAFQHRSTEAGLNLLLTEYGRLYTEDQLVPAGLLRDVRSAAHRAQLIVVSKCPETLDTTQRDELRRRLRLQKGQKLFFSSIIYEPLQAVNHTDITPNRDYNVLCFSGIANPQPLIEELKRSFKKVTEIRFGDHHRFREKDLTKVLKAFEAIPSQEKILVTTEKDYARLRNNPYICKFESAPLFIQPIGVRFHEDHEFREAILNYVRENKHHH